MDSKIFIFVGLVVLAYFFIPGAKEMFQTKNVSNSFVNPIVSNVDQNLSVNSSVVVDPNMMSIVGKPSRDEEFSCRYDRDCELYVSVCYSKPCKCLQDGNCAIVLQ